MRSFILAAVAALVFASAAAAAPHCTTGKPCGSTCIPKTSTCHVPTAPHCTTGVPCGNTCIAKGKVCHIPPGR